MSYLTDGVLKKIATVGTHNPHPDLTTKALAAELLNARERIARMNTLIDNQAIAEREAMALVLNHEGRIERLQALIDEWEAANVALREVHSDAVLPYAMPPEDSGWDFYEALLGRWRTAVNALHAAASKPEGS